MIKEVRYRAYDKRNNIKIESFHLNTINFDQQCVELWHEDMGDYVLWFKDVVLVQYVGLKDKYNVEIYEGDCVEFEFSNETKRGFVEFKGGSFQITTKEKIGNQNVSHLFGYSSSRNHKVIGNIFQGDDLNDEIV